MLVIVGMGLEREQWNTPDSSQYGPHFLLYWENSKHPGVIQRVLDLRAIDLFLFSTFTWPLLFLHLPIHLSDNDWMLAMCQEPCWVLRN
jgi:hypothetical protein